MIKGLSIFYRMCWGGERNILKEEGTVGSPVVFLPWREEKWLDWNGCVKSSLARVTTFRSSAKC